MGVFNRRDLSGKGYFQAHPKCGKIFQKVG
jgi:hypothetical protein